ncbi:MAG: thioredoxin family protein [Candidatus Zixiibacteriota bacterium]|jgi:peroxiredoxin
MTRTHFSILTLLALSVVALAAFAEQKTPETAAVATATVGQTAPDFTLIDANGKSHSLSSFKGKFVVLEWVNFDCPFVRKHYNSGNMPRLQKEMMEKGVVWLGICSSASGKQGYFEGKELTERLKSEGFSANAYLIDNDGKVGRMYGAKTTPHMYIISPEGTLIYAGAIDDKPTTKLDDVKGASNYVVAALQAAMGGKEIATKSTVSYGCSVKY